VAIAELLADPARLRELGRQGREAVHRDFGIEHMARRMAGIYREESGQPA
jgi:glycosyltransferase involved in cell wall biosynthesis